MPLYTYKARDRFGELVSGTIECKERSNVVENLDRLGYAVISITCGRQELSSSIAVLLKQFQRIDKHEVIIFTRQLGTLLRSGMPLSSALTTTCEQASDKRFRLVLEGVKNAVQQGESFSQALSGYPNVFSELFVSMAEVGETGGILDKVLDRLAALGTQELETNSRIKSALIYPIILVVVAFIIANFLVIGVLPKFVSVFRSSQAKLPLPTQIVLGLSWIARRLWLPIFIGLLISAVVFKNYISNPHGRYRFHSWLLKIPIFGELYLKIQISRFARTLSALTSVGIPLLQGMVVVEKIVTNVVLKRVIRDICASITEGKPLAEQFKASGFFSPMVVQMIATGEKSGNLDQMLDDIASFYDPEIEYTIKNLTAILEPIMLLLMGGMVAFIALSVLLPIFNMIRVFRG